MQSQSKETPKELQKQPKRDTNQPRRDPLPQKMHNNHKETQTNHNVCLSFSSVGEAVEPFVYQVPTVS